MTDLFTLHLYIICYVTLKLHDKAFWLSKGWSGGTMVLGKVPVPGRPTNLD